LDHSAAKIMKVGVTDSFEVKAGMAGLKHASGLVVVFDASQRGAKMPKAGSRIRAARNGGGAIDLIVGEVKRHGIGRSFFFEGLSRQDVPIGSVLSWPHGKKTSVRRPRAANV
jgi:hypothetical protein